MSADKSGSPPCGIYLQIDDYSDMQKLITHIRQVAMVINRSSGYKKNMNIVELVYNPDNVQQTTDLVALIQNEGMVAIISGLIDGFNADYFKVIGTDGILLDNYSEFKAVRIKLGDDAIIGIKCGNDRGVAENAIKISADYVVLSADTALISWWRSKTDILCAFAMDGITNKNCGALSRAGASFIDVSNYIMTYEKGTMQATVNILHELECAAQTSETLH